VVVLDADGAAAVERERVGEVLAGALAREEAERIKRAQLEDGALSYDLDSLRGIVEGPASSPKPAQPPGQGTPWA
jgi:hypothetical protein